MAIYHAFTSSASSVDVEAVETTIRATVAGCVVGRIPMPVPADATDASLTYWRVKHPTRTEADPFTPSEVAAIQAAFDAAPPLTPQRMAQQEIDRLPIPIKALILETLDQVNALRAREGLPPMNQTAFLAQARARAGTL